jgi:hypothetical protein
MAKKRKKPDRSGMGRSIGGERYLAKGSSDTKKGAQAKAEKERRGGKKVRVVKEKRVNRQGRKVTSYGVYVSHDARKR